MAGKWPRRERGFREAQQRFEGAAADLMAIFESYGFSCAFTGQDLRKEAAADPAHWLLRLTSDAAVPSELVPACDDAIYAYELGHLAIGPRYNFLVDLSEIVPEFLERLNANGRLVLPRDEVFTPSSAALKAHREAFAEGLVG